MATLPVVPTAPLPHLLLAALLPLLCKSHSIIPNPRDATSSSEANKCYVRLVRRTSKSTLCWPAGDARAGGHFGCFNDSTIWTSGHCAGLFACGNGAVKMCNEPSCTCTQPCHSNQYVQGDQALHRQNYCPPAMPSLVYPPMPPVPPLPPPPAPPVEHGGRHHGGQKQREGNPLPSAPILPPPPPSFPPRTPGRGHHSHRGYHRQHEEIAPTVPPPPPPPPISAPRTPTSHSHHGGHKQREGSASAPTVPPPPPPPPPPSLSPRTPGRASHSRHGDRKQRDGIPGAPILPPPPPSFPPRTPGRAHHSHRGFHSQREDSAPTVPPPPPPPPVIPTHAHHGQLGGRHHVAKDASSGAGVTSPSAPPSKAAAMPTEAVWAAWVRNEPATSRGRDPKIGNPKGDL